MKKQRKGLYEGMYILSASLSEDSRKKAFDKIADGIAQKGGEIHKVHDQGRKRLAYEIKGKREGHYYVVFFSLPAQSIQELWKDYHLHEDLIRFSTMVTDTVQETLEFQPIRIQG
ncbi:MAG: ribosomal protein [Chlamydiota bacterium]